LREILYPLHAKVAKFAAKFTAKETLRKPRLYKYFFRKLPLNKHIMALKAIYNTSLSLLTDLYQLTMAYGYWKNNIHNKEAIFHLFYRKQPFGSGYSISAGLQPAIEYLEKLTFEDDDIEYLKTLKGNDGKELFPVEFLKYLSEFKLELDIDAIPEGTVVFPNEPLIKVKGPLLQCQIVETALLNIVNFQTLVATKAARIKNKANNETVMEFGLRRAQGIDGGLSASRASYIGGADSTSNVLAGKLFDIPISGTHAHSWILSFDNELDAFEAYADALPNNCVFLVDTFDTTKGIENAITVGKKLREKGKELAGIRLDSGDLAYLSIKARKMLDNAGFPKAKVIVSNDLDENLLRSLKSQGAKIDTWGIGTKLATAFDQPALGGVYKLSAIKEKGKWINKIKLSEQSIKINNPGDQQVRRFYVNNKYRFDMIYDENSNIGDSPLAIDPSDSTRRIKVRPHLFEYKDLLVPIFRKGKLTYSSPNLNEIRNNTLKELQKLDPSIKRLEFPHNYPVGLEESLYNTRHNLIVKLREQ
jgi:nicotinate phosphoribosyltransferase